MFGSDVSRDNLGVEALVSRYLQWRGVGDIESGGERVDVGDSSPREHDQRRRVQSARQICTDRHVRHQLAVNRALERRTERVCKAVVRARYLGPGTGS